MALIIVQKPGSAPRLGHTIGDVEESVRAWQAANPGAAIYVIESSVDLPSPGTAWVTTADEYLHMIQPTDDEELSELVD